MKYFLHDSNAYNDEKITELFMNFGYEGLGLFYTLLEKLAFQEKPIKTIVLKKQLKVGKRLEKHWKFMEEIGLISSKNGETFNENILNFSEKYQIKKEKNRKKIAEWRDRKQDNENVTNYEPVRNQRKIKESKVKENKIKESKVKETQIIFPWKDERFIQIWELWKKYKREQHKFSYKQIGETGALNDLYELSEGKLENAMLIIKQSIQKGWKGFFALQGQFQKMVNEYDIDKIMSLINK